VTETQPPDPAALSAIVDGCVDFAREMLEKAGDFYPFGETLDAAGKRAMVGGYDGNEHPDAREIYTLLQGAFRDAARSGQISAAALAVNVNIPTDYESPYPDGIRVLIEAVGYSRYLYFPYRVHPQSLVARLAKRRRVVDLAEPFTVGIPPQLFVPGT
jgi:hypothetical protein